MFGVAKPPTMAEMDTVDGILRRRQQLATLRIDAPVCQNPGDNTRCRIWNRVWRCLVRIHVARPKVFLAPAISGHANGAVADNDGYFGCGNRGSHVACRLQGGVVRVCGLGRIEVGVCNHAPTTDLHRDPKASVHRRTIGGVSRDATA